MTHDELLAHLYDKLAKNPMTVFHPYLQALRAVVEMHGQYKFCQVCDDEDVYPCKTIQAIQKELE